MGRWLTAWRGREQEQKSEEGCTHGMSVADHPVRSEASTANHRHPSSYSLKKSMHACSLCIPAPMHQFHPILFFPAATFTDLPTMLQILLWCARATQHNSPGYVSNSVFLCKRYSWLGPCNSSHRSSCAHLPSRGTVWLPYLLLWAPAMTSRLQHALPLPASRFLSLASWSGHLCSSAVIGAALFLLLTGGSIELAWSGLDVPENHVAKELDYAARRRWAQGRGWLSLDIFWKSQPSFHRAVSDPTRHSHVPLIKMTASSRQRWLESGYCDDDSSLQSSVPLCTRSCEADSLLECTTAGGALI